MPLYKKSILRVGTYHSPDGVVHVTPDRLRHWAKMHRQLSRHKQVVPIDWDHASDPTTAVPMSAAAFSEKRRSAKNTVGHLRRFKVAQDGRSAEIVMDIHRKSAAQAADTNSVFVSPVIFDQWRDGEGHEYSDVITHVDFVNHPVDASQTKFEPVAVGSVACALRFGLQSGRPAVYRLAADADEDDAKKKKNPFAAANTDENDSADDSADNSADNSDMDDEGADSDDPLAGDDDDVIALGDDGPSDDAAPSITDAIPDAGGDEILAQQISADLEAAGIAPPEGVDPIADAKGFLAQLCAALRQKAMDESNNDDESDDGLDVPDQGEQIMETSPEFAAMSLRARAAEQALITMARRGKQDELKRLLDTGRVTADEFNARAKSLQTVSMSLNDQGQPTRIDLDAFLEARQAIPAATMWPADSALRLSMEAQATEPPHGTGAVTPEEAKTFVDAQAARMGGMIKPRA